MTEFETLQRAKMYIDKLSDGVNPIDDTVVSKDDVINNERISKCLRYVSGVLEKTIEEERRAVRTAEKNKAFLPEEEYTNSWFEFSLRPITIEKIIKQINENAHVIDISNVSKVKLKNWLIRSGFLYRSVDCEGNSKTLPTEKGVRLGISVKKIKWTNGSYDAVLYNAKAQKFIIDNIFKIIYN